MRSEQITARALKATGDDRYKLAVLVSKRSEQISVGAKPLVENTQGLKPVDIALLEISEGKISLENIEEKNS
ncbi:MAG: DNA-directed RNA polymerase subunit omega [Campylobacteraceae bacterium]|jgi:DNA-directed RNA polymerase subunit omega|nr:DNA-directed RNA polymerase subunit omega [Campylobacteraceae bacterium]